MQIMDIEFVNNYLNKSLHGENNYLSSLLKRLFLYFAPFLFVYIYWVSLPILLECTCSLSHRPAESISFSSGKTAIS